MPTEAELVRRYGASRSVLREAIKVLNAKGLVTAKPRRGTTVTPTSSWNLFDPDVLRWTLKRTFSLELLIQFTHFRIAVEPHATGLAAKLATPNDVARITTGFEQMQAAQMGDEDELMADIAFHLAILDASQNMFFVRLKPFIEAALSFSIRYTDHIVDDAQAKLEKHYLILEAISRGRAEEAELASRTLLIEGLSLMEAGLNPAPDKVDV